MSSMYVQALRYSGKTIYDPIPIGDTSFWIPSPELEAILNSHMKGLSLAGLPLRTRSKVTKEHVCDALGYPRPASFRKTQPRFPGQDLDIYVQKSNNLQIWNEEISPSRRYVLIRLNELDIVTTVKVVTGEDLALLDTTGTLTQKYQARVSRLDYEAELVTPHDTQNIISLTNPTVDNSYRLPTLSPIAGELMPISQAFERLTNLIGKSFKDVGSDQERNRGAALHALVCAALGFPTYADDGRFPDVRNQLLEVKLQTSPTVDLGLVCPDSPLALDVPYLNGRQLRHCDVRYAVFFANTDGQNVRITNLVMSTGEDFFRKFVKFGGNVLNRKLQIPLPSNFFV